MTNEKQNKKIEVQIEEYRSGARTSIDQWRYIAENGCSDPSWPDGVNMNLIRNHLIYYKQKIREVCEENGFDLPIEAFFPDLPYVDANYFALPKSERAKRIMNYPSWRCRQQEQPQPAMYDETMLALF